MSTAANHRKRSHRSELRKDGVYRRSSRRVANTPVRYGRNFSIMNYLKRFIPNRSSKTVKEVEKNEDC